MAPWRQKLEVRSKRAIQQGIRELRQVGWIKSPTKSFYYARPTLQANGFGWKRIGVATLEDGTKIMVHAIRMSSSQSKWVADWADIKKSGVLSHDTKRLHHDNHDPVVWCDRTSLWAEEILKFWGTGYSTAELRRLHRVFGGPKLFPSDYNPHYYKKLRQKN